MFSVNLHTKINLSLMNKKELDSILSNLGDYVNRVFVVPPLAYKEVPVRYQTYYQDKIIINTKMQLKTESLLSFELDRKEFSLNNNTFLALEVKSFNFENSHTLFFFKISNVEYILLSEEVGKFLVNLLKYLPEGEDE